MEQSQIEEVYIYVEFEESVNIEKFDNIHILGIDSKNPIIQLDDTFFSGTYENPLGTFLFFEEDTLADKSDSLFERLPDVSLKYLTKTRKCIKAEHVYVKQKYGSEQELKSEKGDGDDDIKPVTFNTVVEAVETFKKEFSSNSETSQTTKEEPKNNNVKGNDDIKPETFNIVDTFKKELLHKSEAAQCTNTNNTK